jgi:hypothetical protein
MFPRWDAVVLAATLLGGSMIIENSHRIDTGAPDDEVAAAPANACEEAEAYQMSGIRRGAVVTNDDGYAVSDANDVAPPNGCE